MESESTVKRISVLDVTAAPLPLKESPLIIENGLKSCLASSYWNLNYFRRKLSRKSGNEDFCIPARRWYYQKDILHCDRRLMSFNKFVDNLNSNISILQLQDSKELDTDQGCYFSENTSEDLLQGISETFPWPYNASGGITTIEIFSPYLVHPLRYDERFSNIVSELSSILLTTDFCN